MFGKKREVPVQTGEPKKKKPIYKRVWFWVLVVIIALAVAGMGGGSADDQPAADTQEAQQEVQQEYAQDAEQSAQPEEEDVPQEYKNALAKAKSYSEIMHMSKQGIYDQLVSEYGENFPADAAQYAIDNLDADYKANALEKAKDYYEGMNMSKDGVREQLVSEYGEQFTQEEADYAVANLD